MVSSSGVGDSTIGLTRSPEPTPVSASVSRRHSVPAWLSSHVSLAIRRLMEYLNYSSVPFEIYLTLFVVAFVVISGGGALLRWVLHRRDTGGYLLAGSLGSLIGFVVATAPFIYVTAQHYLTGWFTGHYRSEWPPFWWPSWMPWVGPFHGFLIGTVLGFGVGCCVFYQRNRELAG